MGGVVVSGGSHGDMEMYGQTLKAISAPLLGAACYDILLSGSMVFVLEFHWSVLHTEVCKDFFFFHLLCWTCD